MTDPDYRVTVEVNAHTWDVTYGDAPDYGVMLPLSFGWSFPNNADFYPCQRDPLTGSFSIVAEHLADVEDIDLGDVVRISVYTPAAAATPWQSVVGVVSQLDAKVGDRNVLTVSFTDPTWLLTRMVVGIAAWPQENVGARIQRICAEAGIACDQTLIAGGQGVLAAKDALSTSDALTAVRDTLKDDANLSVGGYGRTVYSYDPDSQTLILGIANRQPAAHPASWSADLSTLHRRVGQPGALDGCVSTTDGEWSKLPSDAYTYVIVDGLIFTQSDDATKNDGTLPIGGVPYIRSTHFVPAPSGLPPVDPSVFAKQMLGASLVPDPGSDGSQWRTDVVRHLSYLDPDPIAGWVADDATAAHMGLGWTPLHLAIVEPIDVDLTLDGRTWVAGSLSGARLTIPPGGQFYVDVTLRPELPATRPGAPGDAMTYNDLPSTRTYNDIDPLLKYRDLNLIGV